MKTVKVKFPCEDIALQGEWLFPDGEGPFPAVVVSHHFPPEEGSMNTPVVSAIWKSLAERGIAALRYNFRGVGESEGSFDNGVGERKDVRAAFEFALVSDEVMKDKIGLAGYSFGAMMSAPVAMREARVGALALLSAPLSEDNWKKLDGYDKPYLVIVGEKDHMVSLDMFRSRMADPPGQSDYRMIAGGDHSLFGYEEEIGSIVSGFFAENLG